MVNWAGETTLWRQVGGKRGGKRFGIGARVVGELDRYRLYITVRNGVVQVFDGALSLDALVKAHKTDSF